MRWWWQLDNWSYKSCKAPVKSSSPTNQHPVFLQAGCTKEYTVEKSHLCVQCVTSSLHGKKIWMCTKEYTVEKSRLCTLCNMQFTEKGDLDVHKRIHSGEKPFVTGIHVVSVSNVFPVRTVYLTIWIFIKVNTSAQNVADVPIVKTSSTQTKSFRSETIWMYCL